MTTTDIGFVMQRALFTTCSCGPIVLVSMGVGLVISVIQAATQITRRR